METKTKRAGVLLRRNGGSYSQVSRVFAFDPDDGRLVLLWDQWAGEQLAEVQVADLEALEEVGGERLFRDVPAELRKRAGYLIRR